MQGINRVFLLGQLEAEPEVYVTRKGAVVLSLRVVTTVRHLEEDGVERERTTYHPVVLIGGRANALSRVLRRGCTVFVEGSLRTSTYENVLGKRWQKTEVMAKDIMCTDTPPEEDPPWHDEGPMHAYDDWGDQ